MTDQLATILLVDLLDLMESISVITKLILDQYQTCQHTSAVRRRAKA